MRKYVLCMYVFRFLIFGNIQLLTCQYFLGPFTYSAGEGIPDEFLKISVADPSPSLSQPDGLSVMSLGRKMF